MLKRSTNKNKIKSQLIVGSLLILMGSIFIFSNIFIGKVSEKNEEKAINEYYEKQEEVIDVPIKEEIKEPINNKVSEKPKINNRVKLNYIAILKIPKINLEKGLVDKNSYYNNVNRNLQLLKDSDLPDKEKGNVIIAGHSGTGRVAYFRNLYKLDINDEVNIIYNNVNYSYKVVNKYEIDKTGEAHIIRNSQKDTLTLITCKYRSNKQIIFICEKI